MQPITSQELDDVIADYITGENVDQSLLEKEITAIVDALKASTKARDALMGAVMHIVQNGPEHVSCGLMNSVGAFFLVAMKLAEQRQKQQKDLAELNSLFPDASSWSALIENPGEEHGTATSS